MILKIYEPGTYEIVPHDGMRKIIASRLVRAKQTIPHFYLTRFCALDALLAVREKLNAHAPQDKQKVPLWKLSVNDFVIKSMALALHAVEHAADSSATETNAIYASRIRKKLPCATPNTMPGRTVSKGHLKGLNKSRRITR